MTRHEVLPVLLGTLLVAGTGSSPVRAAAEAADGTTTTPVVSAPAAENGPPPAAGAALARVQVRGEWLYVDGEPFLIKGIGYSPYRPGQVPWRDRLDPAVVEQDFQRITAAGFNTIRTWSPLPPEILELANQHGLMVLQGIWVEQHGDYTAAAFQDMMAQVIRQEVARAKGHSNVLAFLVGNELLPEQVFRTTVPETETLLKRAAQIQSRTPEARSGSFECSRQHLFFRPAT